MSGSGHRCVSAVAAHSGSPATPDSIAEGVEGWGFCTHSEGIWGNSLQAER